MKISEITAEHVSNYLRITYDDDVKKELEPIMNVSKNFIIDYTGIKESSEEGEGILDDYEDFYIVYMILCQDMYDNRCMYVDNKAMNKVVETILGMHRKNLVG